MCTILVMDQVLTPGFRVFENTHEEDNRLLEHGFSSFLAKNFCHYLTIFQSNLKEANNGKYNTVI